MNILDTSKTFKIIEIVLSLICLTLQMFSWEFSDKHGLRTLVCGTFLGFILVELGEILAMFIHGYINKVLSVFYSSAGCAFFMICGVLLIENCLNRHYKGQKSVHLTKGFFAICNSVVFFLDGFYISLEMFNYSK
ncbi:uncharacterized protein LOC119657912 [Hermetia illucens]|uniref:uncharacterized protein LOC119657912 n=1 Tax=Hermetia illucens TaxID=343691 RepID=UPI0018CBF819|nr:uncharacterized protein LOC119657912 [Hermetia illucens]